MCLKSSFWLVLARLAGGDFLLSRCILRFWSLCIKAMRLRGRQENRERLRDGARGGQLSLTRRVSGGVSFVVMAASLNGAGHLKDLCALQLNFSAKVAGETLDLVSSQRQCHC